VGNTFNYNHKPGVLIPR